MLANCQVFTALDLPPSLSIYSVFFKEDSALHGGWSGYCKKNVAKPTSLCQSILSGGYSCAWLVRISVPFR